MEPATGVEEVDPVDSVDEALKSLYQKKKPARAVASEVEMGTETEQDDEEGGEGMVENLGREQGDL